MTAHSRTAMVLHKLQSTKYCSQVRTSKPKILFSVEPSIRATFAKVILESDQRGVES